MNSPKMPGLAAGIIVSQKNESAVHAKSGPHNPAEHSGPHVFRLSRKFFVPFAQKDARFGRKPVRPPDVQFRNEKTGP
jgi:hypothetical protein